MFRVVMGLLTGGSYFPSTYSKKFILVAFWGLNCEDDIFSFILYEATLGSGFCRVHDMLVLLVLVSSKCSFYWLSCYLLGREQVLGTF